MYSTRTVAIYRGQSVAHPITKAQACDTTRERDREAHLNYYASAYTTGEDNYRTTRLN